MPTQSEVKGIILSGDLTPKQSEDEEQRRKHHQNYYERILPFAFRFLELIFTVRPTKFFVKRYRGCAYDAMSVLRDGMRTIFGLWMNCCRK